MSSARSFLDPARRAAPAPEPAWPRRRLAAWLSDVPADRWLLVGGPGAGKTSAAHALARELACPAHWLDGHRLAEPVAAMDPDAAVRAIESIAGPERAVLVLDAAERLPERVLAGLLSAETRHAVIVTMRPPLPAALGRLAALGQVRLLDPSDLHLSPEETPDRLAGEPSASLLAGWPLGIQALCTLLQRADRLVLLEQLVQVDLLEALPPDVRHTAVVLSILPMLTPEAVMAVEPGLDALAVARLHHWSLLSPGPDGTLGWIPMVQGLLLKERDRLLDEPARRAQDERVAAWLALQDVVRAVTWLVERGQSREAVLLVRRQQAVAARRPDEYGRLQACLRALPGELAGLSEVLLAEGDLMRSRGEIAEAASRYERAKVQAVAQGDRALAYECLISRLHLEMQRRVDWEAFGRIEAEAARFAAEASEYQRHRYLLMRALMHAIQGAEAAAVDLYRQVLGHPHFGDPDFATLHLQASLLLGIRHENRGDFVEAPRHFERVLALFDLSDSRPSAATCARLMLALMASHQGDFAAARDHLSRLPAVAFEDPIREAVCRRLEAECHLCQGDLEQAEALVMRVLSLLGSSGAAEHVEASMALNLLAIIRRLQGEVPAALGLHKSAMAKATALQDSRAMVQRDWALTLLAAGEPQEAASRLEAALSEIGGVTAPFRELTLVLALAVARFRLGANAAADDAIRRAAALIRQGPYYYALLLFEEVSADAWLLLLRANEHDLLARIEARFPERAERVRRALAGRTALAPRAASALEIRTFGDLEVRVGDQVMDWPRKKAKALLALLLLAPRGLKREELVDALFGELAEKAAQGRLDQLLFSLRKVLGASRLTYKDGRYELQRQEVWVDVEAFDRAFERGSSARQKGDAEGCIQAYEEALELYRGPLFAELPDDHELERHHYLTRVLELLGHLAEIHLKAEQAERARACLQRLLELDGLNEPAHRQLMELYLRFGRPDLARRQYRLLETWLRRELDVSPCEETRVLAAAFAAFPEEL